MSVFAKLKCTAATEYEGGSKRYEFWAVTDERNKAWADATPSGKFEFTVNNPDAQVFVPGRHYIFEIHESG